jgi:hypothetical protein
VLRQGDDAHLCFTERLRHREGVRDFLFAAIAAAKRTSEATLQPSLNPDLFDKAPSDQRSTSRRTITHRQIEPSSKLNPVEVVKLNRRQNSTRLRLFEVVPEVV